MFLEFQAALDAVVNEVFPDCSVKPTVVPAPHEVSEQMASNVAFEISSKLRASGIQKLPASVAAQLLAAFEKSESSQFFTVSIGGDGYLNSSPTPEFTKRFLAALEREPALLLQDRTCVLASTGEGAAGSFFEPIIDLDRIRTKLEQRGRDDVVDLLDSPSFDDMLMVFAASSDPEIDLRAYKAGAGTSEAVPWYLNRVQHDAQRFLQILGQKRSTAISPSVPKYAQTAYGRAAAFRGRAKIGDRRTNAVRLVGGLLELAGGFYKFFNRPNCRVPSQLTGSDALTYRILSQTVAETTKKGLELLSNSCEDRGPVLEK